jgi:hypothetical protein
MLPGIGLVEVIISGQAVRFPLLVKIDDDQNLVGTRRGEENFNKHASESRPGVGIPGRGRATEGAAKLATKACRSSRMVASTGKIYSANF